MRQCKVPAIIGVLTAIAILFTYQSGHAITLPEGTLVTSPLHTSVYEIRDGKRHGFFSADVYHTWYSDFKGVRTVSVQELESIELGDPMPIKQSTKLLKFPLNPNVYAVTDYAYIQHIPDEQTAISHFGSLWASTIIELPELFYLFYEKGPGLERVTHATSNELVSAGCPNRADYTQYTVNPIDESVAFRTGRFSFCVPNTLTFEETPSPGLYAAEMAGQQYETIIMAENVKDNTVAEEIVLLSNPTYNNTDITSEELISGLTLATHRHVRPGGMEVMVIEFMKDHVNKYGQIKTRSFSMNFGHMDIDTQLDVLESIKQILKETFSFL